MWAWDLDCLDSKLRPSGPCTVWFKSLKLTNSVFQICKIGSLDGNIFRTHCAIQLTYLQRALRLGPTPTVPPVSLVITIIWWQRLQKACLQGATSRELSSSGYSWTWLRKYLLLLWNSLGCRWMGYYAYTMGHKHTWLRRACSPWLFRHYAISSTTVWSPVACCYLPILTVAWYLNPSWVLTLPHLYGSVLKRFIGFTISPLGSSVPL